jgi:hypothetical protein
MTADEIAGFGRYCPEAGRRMRYLRFAAGVTMVTMIFSTILNFQPGHEQGHLPAWMQVTTLAEEHSETAGKNEGLTRKP